MQHISYSYLSFVMLTISIKKQVRLQTWVTFGELNVLRAVGYEDDLIAINIADSFY